MLDALYPGSIPAGTHCDIIAAYIDHTANPQSYQQAIARFPDAIHLRISVKANVADILDCETSTGITPAMCPPWVLKCRAAGVDPTVYCNQNNGWAQVRQAFAAASVAEPHYWVANYNGDPTIPVGAVAKQWTDLDQNGHNTYDTSSTVAGWPGLTPSGGGSPITGDSDLDALQDARLSNIEAICANVQNYITASVAPNASNAVAAANNAASIASDCRNALNDPTSGVLVQLGAIQSTLAHSTGAVDLSPVLAAIALLPAQTIAALKAAL